ncbi:MAG: M42 family metallopeptidase [Candidatus Omnitrophota bacterium]
MIIDIEKEEAFFREITQAPGASGFEEEIRSVIHRHLEGLADEITTDRLGSLIAMREGENSNVRLMLIAHMDEVGFLVKGTDKRGYIRFLPIGGWNAQTALGQRVTIQTKRGPVFGVIGAPSPHELKEEQLKKAVKLEDLWIDAGVSLHFNPVQEYGIRPGDPIVPYGELQRSANPKVWMARNWDDRIGCAILLKIFQAMKTRKPPCTVYGVFSVQEEPALRGAATSSWIADPDLALAVDVSFARDAPGDPEEDYAPMGGGACLIVCDNWMLPNRKLRDSLLDLSEREKIPCHLSYLKSGYDTGRVHLHKQGVPSCVLGVPSRYIHGFASLIHEDDANHAANLALHWIENVDADYVRNMQSFL